MEAAAAAAQVQVGHRTYDRRRSFVRLMIQDVKPASEKKKRVETHFSAMENGCLQPEIDATN
jgi:hypothetical protein